MKMVVVGGNSRDIGKTSVVAGLIRALRHHHWTAIKLTQYGHGVCSNDGEECGCEPQEHPFAIDEETDTSGRTDTSRFLLAGARRALWVRVRWGMLDSLIPTLQQAIAGEEHVILESNSILRYFQPNVYLTVLDPAVKDFKTSAQEFLQQADACLILEPGLEGAAWEGIPLETVQARRVFSIRRDSTVPPEIVEFVEKRLAATESARCLV